MVPARRSLSLKALPIGLAHGVTLTRDVRAGSIVTENDVTANAASQALQARRAMVARFGT